MDIIGGAIPQPGVLYYMYEETLMEEQRSTDPVIRP